ncbi:hypothetical protein D9Q98_007241 [Chlorella vulgaris]|uniref:Uncharacterized protein n=1 Tax=Chlorella vulgaris TaxID=3077 RepID=A0A9D4YVK6_CHLVU|nr:hypothetical protein D9Q98_007241 [Chlorella vulgaris]
MLAEAQRGCAPGPTRLRGSGGMVPPLLYADDTTLLATSADGLQRQHDLLQRPDGSMTPCERHAMTRQTQLRLALGSLSLLLLCVHPCMATQCASLGLACSASPPPPPPQPGDCLADGTAWTYDATTECCSGYAFGVYCGCLPVGEPVQVTAVECCSRKSDGGSPNLCITPCVEKSAVCDCRERRRSLQKAGYQQCNCCDGLLCSDNSNYTSTFCAGPPSDPGIDGLMVIEGEPYVYSVEITLIASDDTGAVGMDIEYVVEGQATSGNFAFSAYGSPSPLKFVEGVHCGKKYITTVFARNFAGLVSRNITEEFTTPLC